MKHLLIRPPDPMGMVDILSHTEPTNIGYVASYAISKGFEIDIWDYEKEPFHAKGFLERLEAYSPVVVGLSCMTPTIINGHKIAQLIKTYFPEITVVVGGAHSSALPVQTLEEFQSFDLVINQEGEATFSEILDYSQSLDPLTNIPGTTWRNGGEALIEPSRGFIDNLDDIPFPARELYHGRAQLTGHSSRGFSNKLRTTEIFTSRGCPYQCTFCAIAATFDRTLRFRSMDNISEEISEVIKRYAIQHFVIADDTFGLKKGRLELLCDVFKTHNVNSWSCDTRIDAVDKRSLQLMRDAGCTKVAFGIETGSQRVTNLNEKKIDLNNVEQVIRWANESGIRHVEANFIVGSHPDEKLEDLEATRKLLQKLPLSFISVSITVPYPGTPNFTYMNNRQFINSKDWSKYVMFGQTPDWCTTHFSSDDLLAYQKRLSRSFYLRPSYISRMLKSIRSTEELRYYSKSGLAFLKWLTGINLVRQGQAEMDLETTGFVQQSISS